MAPPADGSPHRGSGGGVMLADVLGGSVQGGRRGPLGGFNRKERLRIKMQPPPPPRKSKGRDRKLWEGLDRSKLSGDRNCPTEILRN